MNSYNEDTAILNLISCLHILKPNRQQRESRIRIQDEIDAELQGSSYHRFHRENP